MRGGVSSGVSTIRYHSSSKASVVRIQEARHTSELALCTHSGTLALVPDSSPTEPRRVPAVPADDTAPDGLPAPRPSSDSVPLALRIKKARASLPGLLPEDAERCRIHGRWEQLIEI